MSVELPQGARGTLTFFETRCLQQLHIRSCLVDHYIYCITLFGELQGVNFSEEVFCDFCVAWLHISRQVALWPCVQCFHDLGSNLATVFAQELRELQGNLLVLG